MELPLPYGTDLIAWSWREWFFFGLGIASTVVVVILSFISEADREVIAVVNDVINTL